MSGNADTIEKKVKAAVKKTGLPTEIKATEILKRNNWIVFNEYPYIDKENNRVRTLDIQALKGAVQASEGGLKTVGELTENISDVELYIECKKSEKPWVFYIDHMPYAQIYSEIEGLCEKMFNKTFTIVIDEYAESGKLPKVSSRKEHVDILCKIPPRFEKIKYNIALSHQIVFVSHNTSENDGKDEIYSAEMQLLKALVHQDEKDKILSSARIENKKVIPIILLDGALFGCYFENQELCTPKIAYTRHLAYGLPNQKMPALIDVVTLDYFPEYLKLIESELFLHPETK